jgi:ribosome-binding protein aMBF1 (putative translation factor)
MSIKTRPCEICRNLIEPERIEAIPETRLCGDHARKVAKFGGEFTLSSTQESLGKVGSLKKNYGGITPSKTRNTQAIRLLLEEYEAMIRENRTATGIEDR